MTVLSHPRGRRPSWMSTASVVLLCMAALVRTSEAGFFSRGSGNADSANDDDRCALFLAPSTLESVGWGVFAGRDLDENEFIELPPLMLTFSGMSAEVKSTVLADYVYEYHRYSGRENNYRRNQDTTYLDGRAVSRSVMLFGYGSYINHHPNSANMRFTCFGVEPTYYDVVGRHHFDTRNLTAPADTTTSICGFIARRPIQAGEELFTNYGGGTSDGRFWFHKRQLEMAGGDPNVQLGSGASTDADADVGDKDDKDDFKSERRLQKFRRTHKFAKQAVDQYKAQYCSSSQAGMSYDTWKSHVVPVMDEFYREHHENYTEIHRHTLLDVDAGVHNVTAKMHQHQKSKYTIAKGQRIEISPALIVTSAIFQNSALEPLLLRWGDFTRPQQTNIRSSRELHKAWIVQFQGVTSDHTRVDRFASYNDIAVLSLAGNIALYARADGSNSANCKLIVHPNYIDPTTQTPMGMMLEVVATKKIKFGDKLVLGTSSAKAVAAAGGDPRQRRRHRHEALRMLQHEVEATGQSTFHHFSPL